MSLINNPEQQNLKSNNNHFEVYAMNQKGFSLIEVLVSMLLISFGLLSLGNLQTRNLHFSTEAYTETQKALYLKEIVEVLRANKDSAKLGDYNTSLTSFSDLATASSSFAEIDRYNWFNNLNNVLPGAKASINCGNDSRCVLEVQYTATSGIKKQYLAIIL